MLVQSSRNPNARVVDGAMVLDGEQVAIGDIAPDDTGLVDYEVLCLRHYMRRMTSPAARTVAISPEVLPFDLDLCPIPAPTPRV